MSELKNMFTEKVNKIALNANDDKRPQTFYWRISYPYGTGPGIMCKAELMRYPLIKNEKNDYDEVPGENKQEQNPQSNNSATIQW